MDRDAIERRDFPVGRRGYDPAAVDAHLRAVADEMDSLRERAAGAAARRGLAAGASEQVRAILEAAEQRAAEIRGEAGREASEHVGRVTEAAAAMLSRLDQLQGELDGLLGRAAHVRRGARGPASSGCRRTSAGSAPRSPRPPEPPPVPPPPHRRPSPEAPVIEPEDASPRPSRPATRPARG